MQTERCELCGDLVKFDLDTDDDDAEIPICSCCLSIICDKHTAKVTCPHQPSAHDQEASADDQPT